MALMVLSEGAVLSQWLSEKKHQHPLNTRGFFIKLKWKEVTFIRHFVLSIVIKGNFHQIPGTPNVEITFTVGIIYHAGFLKSVNKSFPMHLKKSLKDLNYL